MRLWSYELLPYLPKGQLLSQKRECDLMLKDYYEGRKTNHILINYVWDYPIEHLYKYYELLEIEFAKRYFEFNSKIQDDGIYIPVRVPFPNHHNSRYLLQNFFNLQEKYDRGQADFSYEEYKRLENFVKEKGLIRWLNYN